MSEEWREWQIALNSYVHARERADLSPEDITKTRISVEAATRALMEKAAIMGMATILHQRFSSEPPPNRADHERARAIVRELTGEP